MLPDSLQNREKQGSTRRMLLDFLESYYPEPASKSDIDEKFGRNMWPTIRGAINVGQIRALDMVSRRSTGRDVIRGYAFVTRNRSITRKRHPNGKTWKEQRQYDRRQARVQKAITLLESEGYTVSPNT